MALFDRRALALMAGGSLFGLFACQQILGLDDRKNCNDEPCADASADAEPDPDAEGRDAARDAETDGAEAGPVFPLGSSGSDWITFRMPSTDRGLIDAAAFDSGKPFVFAGPDIQAFDQADAGVPVVVDRTTKRTWLVMTIARTTSEFEKARQECERDKGRVPSRIELVSLFDTSPLPDAGAGDASPPLMIRPEVLGTSGLPSVYWSSTAVQQADRSFKFWVFDFAQGRTFLAADKSASYGVLCVLK